MHGTHRVGLVAAPAGAGKTTLLAQFVERTPDPVAWYRAEEGDASAPMFLHALATSLAPIVPALRAEPSSIDELITGLDAVVASDLVLVVDDAHALVGTPAETLLARLVEYAPPSVRLLLASRTEPGFDLSRLRLSGEVLDVPPDELRFRYWEVEELFRKFYREPLPPEDLAELTRRTEGWAGGLQLFHLATRGKPMTERRRMVAELGGRSRMVGEYLARNVVDQLRPDLRAFLLGTCVLGRLTGSLCDELLGRAGSGHVLRELERRRVFTVALEDGVYRYHEVLRSHLELTLVEEVGDAEAKQRYRRAGRLLERAGVLPEALRAYGRAEDWPSVAALVDRQGRQLADERGSWLEALPPGVRDHDPWMLLAGARHDVASGRLSRALEAYQRAARAFGSSSGGDVCRRERQAVAAWLEPFPPSGSDWLSLLRAATQRHPLGIAERAATVPGATARFAEGVATLLAGGFRDAEPLLLSAAGLPDMPPLLGSVARLLANAAAFVATGTGSTVLDLLEDIEACGMPWLTVLGRAMAILAADRDTATARAVALGQLEDDPWGTAVVTLLDGFLRLWRGRPASQPFDDAAAGFHRVGAGVGEAWARSGLAVAMAREGHPEAEAAAVTAERGARSAGVPGAEALAWFALGMARGDEGRDELERAATLAARCGMRFPPHRHNEPEAGSGRHQTIPPATAGTGEPTSRQAGTLAPVLRCFGAFRLELEGRVIDCRATLKPRPRALLHLLAVHAGRPVHRERLIEALWPEADTGTGTRNLHVAVSTIRGLLDQRATRGSGSLVARDGDAYRLALPRDAAVDLWVFDEAMAEGRTARAAGDADGAVAAFERAVEVYPGELLPEVGPADWIVVPRERYRVQAGEAALALAEVRLRRGEATAAMAAAERGLGFDPYRDPLWRALIRACDAAGDRVTSARARRAYDEILAELGITRMDQYRAGA